MVGPSLNPASCPEPELHSRRAVAESFGADAERYDRARSSYPPELIRRVVSGCPGTEVLDVGCGTGIVARQLRAAGCRVLGVDPDPRMAAVARRGGLLVEVSRFEEWDTRGRAFDAVVSGQAWHWIDPMIGAEKAAGVLREGGRLTVFWSADRAPADLVAAFGEVYREVMPDALAARRWVEASTALDGCAALCAKAEAGIRAAGAFGAPERWRFDWQRSYTRDEWLDQVPTTGDHGRFPRQRLDRLLSRLGAVIDARGGSFTMPYTTIVATAARAR